jgi:uncharacterized delta-60 repeat protein
MSKQSRCDRRPLCEGLEGRTLFFAGGLDTSFNGTGTLALTIGGVPLQCTGMGLQSDGSIIVVGQHGDNPAVVRVTPSGVIDSSFGNNGIWEFPRDQMDQVNAVTIQPDNRIVVGGYDLTSDQKHIFAVARLTVGGTPDLSFGTNGIRYRETDYGSRVTALAMQRDGKIVAVGWAFTGGIFSSYNDDFMIVRYDTDGTPDAGFDDDGIKFVGFGADEDANAVAIDYNGTAATNPLYGFIVVSGSKYGDNSPGNQLALTRLTPQGQVDNSFDSDGRVVTSGTTGYDFSQVGAGGLIIQPGDKIVATGVLIDNSGHQNNDFGMIRYLSNGAPDLSFGSAPTGIRQTDFFGTADVPTCAIMNNQGGILVGGQVDPSPNQHVILQACTPDGVPDNRFGGGGGTLNPTSFSGTVAAMATTSPHRFYVATTGGILVKYFDVASIMSIGSLGNTTAEGSPNSATFIVARTHHIGTAERVYLDISGTATPPGAFPHRPADYTGTNIHFGEQLTLDRTYVDIPANDTFTQVTITAVDDTIVEGDESVVFSVAPDSSYDIGNPTSVLLLIHDNDTTGGPVVTSAAFNYETFPQQVQFRFNQDVASSVSASAFQITGPPGMPSHGYSYNEVNNTVSLNFTGRLPDGNYTARAIASGLKNYQGLPMASDYTFDFFFLNGDANHDHHVDVSDLGALATNWQRNGKTFSQGDFNYDGTVDVTDLGLLATNWQVALPTASSTTKERTLAIAQSAPSIEHRKNDSADLSQSVLS